MSAGTRTSKKDSILEAALQLFVAKGVTETTVRDIATRADVAEGSLYRHYVSKDELAWDLFSRNFVAFAQGLDRVQLEHATLQAKLEAMIEHFCAFFDRDQTMFTYLLLAQHGQLKRVTSSMPHPNNVLRDVIADGMRRREIPETDPEVAAAMVLGLVLQVALNRIYGRIDHPLASLAPELARASWRVLRP